jgi:predicted TIM-barrel fold metal-dependent hydrolase
MAKLLMISADSHGAVNPQDYAAWLDPQYRDQVDDLIRHTQFITDNVWVAAPDEKTLKVVDTRGSIARGGKYGLWDPELRLRELEAEGFVGEVIFPGDMSSVGMYYNNLNMPYPADYRAAGVKAHNRWLAEFCSYAPKRMFGVAQMEPWPDMEACVREIAWARKAGLSVIGLPRYAGIEPNQPCLTSREWDPFWKACVDNGFVAAIHVGNQKKQGSEIEGILEAKMPEKGSPQSGPEIRYDPGRRPLWQMILGGVFDRFPELKVTFTELRSEWVAPTLAHLESRFDAIRFSGSDIKLPQLRPTDYWRRNCGVAGPMKPYEASLRHQIGVETVMFGHDYPHPEGSWPNSQDWLRLVLKGVPERDARLILGENAARIYGFDLDHLAPLVERFGPEPSAILGDHPVPPDLIENFRWRADFFARSYHYDAHAIDPIMEADERTVAAA